jgi:hypothetical protein
LCTVETVTVESSTGRLLLPDKWGDVHEALLLADGSYQLNPKPLAQLGPGRVLGSKLDADGNLVMCDVLKVRAAAAAAAAMRGSNTQQHMLWKFAIKSVACPALPTQRKPDYVVWFTQLCGLFLLHCVSGCRIK